MLNLHEALLSPHLDRSLLSFVFFSLLIGQQRDCYSLIKY